MLLGKFIGLGLVLLLITKWYLPKEVFAAAPPPLPPPHINAINTVWTLVAAYLVFCMQVGFVMLESGFARSRETVNILVEGIADTCICGVTFWLWGFAFMFCSGTPWIGTTGFMLHGLAGDLRHDGRSVACILGIPVCIRGYLLHRYFGRHDRTLRLHWRLAVQRRRHWFHLPDYRSLGLGSGWLAGQHESDSVP